MMPWHRLDGNKMKRVSLIILVGLLLMPLGSLAYGQTAHVRVVSLNPEEGVLTDVSNFVKDLAVSYSDELGKGANTTVMELHPGRGEDAYFMEQQKRQAEVIFQTALRSVVRQTIEQVDLIHALKVYGQRLTTAQLRVTADNVHVLGPSLRRGPLDGINDPLIKKPVLSIRTGMSLTDNMHLTPMIQARTAHLTSKVIYNPFVGGDWRLSVGRAFKSRSSVEMAYLFRSTDDQDLVATLRFGF